MQLTLANKILCQCSTQHRRREPNQSNEAHAAKSCIFPFSRLFSCLPTLAFIWGVLGQKMCFSNAVETVPANHSGTPRYTCDGVTSPTRLKLSGCDGKQNTHLCSKGQSDDHR